MNPMATSQPAASQTHSRQPPQAKPRGAPGVWPGPDNNTKGTHMTRKVAILAACLITALTATAALAATSNAAMTLPTFSGTATEGKGDDGASKFSVKGGASLIDTSGSGSGTFNSGSRNLGPGSVTLLGLTQGGEPCHELGLAASSTTVAFTGEWHLVLFVKGGVDDHYALFLLPSFGVHVECPAAAVKLLTVFGSILGLISQKTGSTRQFSVKVLAPGGVQEFSEYENDAGTAVKTKLETSQENGARKESFENIEAGLVEFPTATSIEN
jgi:hypothetical protein